MRNGSCLWRPTIRPPENLELARQVLEDVRSGRQVLDAMRHYPLPEGGYLGKHVLVAAYRRLVESGVPDRDPGIEGGGI